MKRIASHALAAALLWVTANPAVADPRRDPRRAELLREVLEAHAEAPLELAAVSSALFGGAAIIGSHLWRRRFRRGPLEGAMRALTRRRA